MPLDLLKKTFDETHLDYFSVGICKVARKDDLEVNIHHGALLATCLKSYKH